MARSANNGGGLILALLGIGAGGLLASKLARSRKVATTTTMKRTPANAPVIRQLVERIAPAMGVPVSLVMSIIGIESGYNPNAKNVTSDRAIKLGGAWGLGQMTLVTAKDITKRFPTVAARYWPSWDGTGPGLLNPNVNTAMTTFLLSRAWQRYANRPNRWLTAGVAHHQGMGTIDKLLAKHGRISADVLPPHGRTYYGMIEKEHATNPIVASLYTNEVQQGARYA